MNIPVILILFIISMFLMYFVNSVAPMILYNTRRNCMMLIPNRKYLVEKSQKEFKIGMNLAINEPLDATEMTVMKATMQNIVLKAKFKKEGLLYTVDFEFYNPDLKMVAKWNVVPTNSLLLEIQQSNGNLVMKLNNEVKAISDTTMFKGLSYGHILLNPSNRSEITVNKFYCI